MMQIAKCCRAMIAIGTSDGRTCAARKSMPDIETNVRPILSDIATPKVIDGPRYSISRKSSSPAVPVAGAHFRSRTNPDATCVLATPHLLPRQEPSDSAVSLIPSGMHGLGQGIPDRRKVILENSVSSLIAPLLLERPLGKK